MANWTVLRYCVALASSLALSKVQGKHYCDHITVGGCYVSVKQKKPFSGYDLCMMLAEQLGITDIELGLALNGKGKTRTITQWLLEATRPLLFLF